MSGEVKAKVVSIEPTNRDGYYWGIAKSESQFLKVRFSVNAYRAPRHEPKLGYYLPFEARIGDKPPRKPEVGDYIYFIPRNTVTADRWCFAFEWEGIKGGLN